jgi:DNA-binding SARP family transcriptional activator
VRALTNGQNVPLGGAKQKTVLASLLLAGNGVLSDDRLTRLLWDANPPTTARAQIHTYVSRLRMRLGPHLEIERRHHGYVVRTRHAWVDHREFRSLTEAAHFELSRGEYQASSRHLRQALALWRGAALSDVTQHLACLAAPEMEESRMAALEARIESDLRLGRHASLVPELTGLVGEFPFRERLRAQLMTALYHCDRQADALAVYESGRRSLAEELGIDPGETLARTRLAVLTGDFSAAPFAAGPPERRREPMPAINWAGTTRNASREARILTDVKPDVNRGNRRSHPMRILDAVVPRTAGYRQGQVELSERPS